MSRDWLLPHSSFCFGSGRTIFGLLLTSTLVPIAFEMPYDAVRDGSASGKASLLQSISHCLSGNIFPLDPRALGCWRKGGMAQSVYCHHCAQDWAARARVNPLSSVMLWQSEMQCIKEAGKWGMEGLKAFFPPFFFPLWSLLKTKSMPLGLKGCMTAGCYKAKELCSLEIKFCTKAACITSLFECF